MRMWMINPKLMCRKHLLGEHVELHMLEGAIRKRGNLKGFAEKGLIELLSMDVRHEAIKCEMLKRGYNHRSPFLINLREIAYLSRDIIYAKVDREESRKELIRRCEKCRKLIIKE